jgi:hypothetical protein
MLVQNNFEFDYNFESISSKLSGLSNKQTNMKKWIDKFFAIKGIYSNLDIDVINNFDVNYDEFVDIVLNKINEGFSIEVSAPLKKDVWMTDGKGWEKPNSDKAGHQMNFEGFDNNGNILVCSWGKTYMFPKEFYSLLEFSAIKINLNDYIVNKEGKSR